MCFVKREPRPAADAAPRVIGRTTRYVGEEVPGYSGVAVRIFAVMRGALRPDVDVDAPDLYVTDDAQLAVLGGVTAQDRLDVAHVRADGTASFVHVDARAVDLEFFAALRR